MTFSSTIGRLRLVGLLEGISYLVLLFLAMPLKYFMDIPEAVSIVGAAHGALFVAYVLAIAHVQIAHRWSLWHSIKAFIAAFIPFATFILDKEWKKEQK
ncbi:DUF3817 domain-containing protein [Bacillus sp. CGMCC 1.16541]|uniref:DUF3817 domain-containing protein n=1 Tax=Bacillus sp. CGMCC 1.16541 TaxID=2185143 RepID=UPI000D73D60C|nr:DUF3817 domain-containing protein [Bacillus sp. CGMCC 1.16541]